LPSSCDSRHAAGAGFGGYSTPLRPHPRIARIPFQATSGWGNVVSNTETGLHSLLLVPQYEAPNVHVWRKMKRDENVNEDVK
jgi:hypothetical protein